MSKDEKIVEADVRQALENLRPYLKKDGGDMEFIEITDDKVVKVKLLGSCMDCSMSSMTMKVGLEEAVKKVAPEIVRVEAINLPEEA